MIIVILILIDHPFILYTLCEVEWIRSYHRALMESERLIPLLFYNIGLLWKEIPSGSLKNEFEKRFPCTD
jgi:hypothetical protein